MYCAGTALLEPTGDCLPGYYCPGGAATSNPVATICTAGHYCLRAVAAQTPCPPGDYCATQGLTQPTGKCFPGFYCLGGSPQPDPPAGLCIPGHYCLEGSEAPLPCPSGEPTRARRPAAACTEITAISTRALCLLFLPCYRRAGRRRGDRQKEWEAQQRAGRRSGRHSREQKSPPLADSPLPAARPGTFSAAFGNLNITDCGPCAVRQCLLPCVSTAFVA